MIEDPDFMDTMNDMQQTEQSENNVNSINTVGMDGEMKENENTEKQTETVKMIEMEENFTDWHNQSKNVWKKMREKRKEMNKNRKKRGRNAIGYDDNEMDGGSQKKHKSSNMFSGLIQQKLNDLYNTNWQIIQIVPGDKPGNIYSFFFCFFWFVLFGMWFAFLAAVSCCFIHTMLVL